MVRKWETAVYEDMLGLEHCQFQYSSESIMREVGFNDIACLSFITLLDMKNGNWKRIYFISEKIYFS